MRLMYINQNQLQNTQLKPTVMFVDLNSFFPSCEQQVNYWLRHRPVGVCVYTGKQGAVIALSKEAKKMGIKPARLDEIMPMYPEFVPIETNPDRYREFHVKIMKVLRQYCDDVIPKSVDEAILNFASYSLVHEDLKKVAQEIKQKIKKEVGDWFTCSIGIAPNAFLAKLGTEIQKPDGLVIISSENIDTILEDCSLTDFPGISKQLAKRLIAGGIHTPRQMRHAPVPQLRKACRSIIGEFWHHRLNFKEVDLNTDNYKSMQAMRQISKEQRASINTLYDILRALCLQLEKRLAGHNLYAHFLAFSCKYEDGSSYYDYLQTDIAIQGAIEMQDIVLSRIREKEKEYTIESIINCNITRMSIWVTKFSSADYIQLALFGDSLRKDNLRKVVYSVKEQFGFEKIQLAGELTDTPVMKDVIGFGSIKDLTKQSAQSKAVQQTIANKETQ